ncbi:MAG: CDP-glycerol glycerophosphotransferase family protein [Proteobacteria bacterium]|nr:CDP-glycerol glycerophosphotransferase family protein [Pseudomonadota bacterium]
MKALFLTDNIPAMDMLALVASHLSHSWDVSFIHYGGLAKQDTAAIDDSYRKLLGGRPMRYISLKKHSKKEINRVLSLERPDILVLTREETTPVEPLFLELGKEKGIPTLLVPHGMRVPNMERVWEAEGKFARLKSLTKLAKQGYRKLVRNPISAPQLLRTGIFRAMNDFKHGGLSRYDRFSKIAVYGPAMREILIGEGVSPDNVVVTGSPKMDRYLTDEGKDNSLPVGDKVLLLTNYFVEFGLWNTKQRERFILDVCSVVGALSSHTLRIKIHPVSEDIRDYENIVRKYDLHTELYQHCSLSELISECDIAITTTSTTGLEAMAAGKPMIAYNPHHNVTAYGNTSGAFLAYNVTELFFALLGLLKDGVSKDQREMAAEFVYQQAYIQDGKAADRIVDLIIKTVEGSENN